MGEGWSDAEIAALRKLIARVHADPDWLDGDEARIVREMVQTYEGVRAFGRFARMVVVTLAAIAAAAAAWDTIVEKVRAWSGA